MAEDQTVTPGFASHSAGLVWTTIKLDLCIVEMHRAKGVDGTVPREFAREWRLAMLELLNATPNERLPGSAEETSG